MIRLPPRRPVFGDPDAWPFAAPPPQNRHVIGGGSAFDDALEGFLTAGSLARCAVAVDPPAGRGDTLVKSVHCRNKEAVPPRHCKPGDAWAEHRNAPPADPVIAFPNGRLSSVAV